LSNTSRTELTRRFVPSNVPRLHVNKVVHRVLASRGITNPAELQFALADLPHPDTLPDIDRALSRLVLAHERAERVLIVGDYDCDGATSTALMMRALTALGYTNLDFLIPDRAKHGYGLSPAVVDVGIEQHKPSLIITVDNGVAAHDAIDHATALGIDVLVTDHHLPADTLPNAVAVVNPSRQDSSFPSQCLAGVGVAFYVLVALRKALHKAGRLSRNVRMADWLDLVAIGTVADVVPLDKINRILVEQGLRRIRSGASIPGILALIEAAGRQRLQLSSADLGMVIGPRLNAAGRIDDMRVGVQCLLVKTNNEASLLANALQGLNDQRRSIQADMQAEAEKIVTALQLESAGTSEKFAYAVHHPEWHQGVIGIVAGRLKDQLHRPVVVFASDGDQLIKGSARSIPGVNIRDALYQVDVRLPGVIERYGGHAMAAGLTLRADALAAFTEALNDSIAEALSHVIPVRSFNTDGALSLADINLSTASLLAFIAPWGTRFDAPLFDNNFVIERSRLVGNNRHAQLSMRPVDESSGDVGAPVSAIAFGDNRTFAVGAEVHAVYELAVNRFRDEESVQLILRHIDEQ